MKKRVAVLGSTGSIGTNTLSILRSMPENFRVSGLTANRNIALFRKQLEYWQPEIAAVQDESTYKKLKSSTIPARTRLLAGTEGITEVACAGNADIVICAISGSPALIPLYEAVKTGKFIGLASKEPVVMTGRLLIEEAEKHGSTIIPVDSEPNAIFQCIGAGGPGENIRRLILTASGGPFRRLKTSELSKVSRGEALRHPKWRMGEKISVDSATLINKGLEVIEASSFFRVPLENIEVVIHPEAKIHSMVEFIDGNIMALISETDMRIPIQYALTYPDRTPALSRTLDLLETGKLRFLKPNVRKFPGLAYCYEAGKTGGTMPAVLNGANEIAVESFLSGRLKFTEIAEICRETMKLHAPRPVKSVAQALEADSWAKKQAGDFIRKWN